MSSKELKLTSEGNTFHSLPLPPLFLQERCMFLHLAFCGILHKHVFRSLIMRRVLCGTLWFDHYCSFWSANPVSDQKNKSASRPRTDNSKWMPNCWYSQKEKCLRDIASRIYAHWHNHRHHHHDHHHELKEAEVRRLRHAFESESMNNCGWCARILACKLPRAFVTWLSWHKQRIVAITVVVRPTNDITIGGGPFLLYGTQFTTDTEMGTSAAAAAYVCTGNGNDNS